jgi:hypothetical protein
MTPQRQLDSFLAKFDPSISALARRAILKMRKRLPNAIEFVYDNYNALVVGFGPNERPSDAIFSIAIFPRKVGLCFFAGRQAARSHTRGSRGAATWCEASRSKIWACWTILISVR